MVGWARREKEEQEEELFGDDAFLRVPPIALPLPICMLRTYACIHALHAALLYVHLTRVTRPISHCMALTSACIYASRAELLHITSHRSAVC